MDEEKDQRCCRTEETKAQVHRRDIGESTDPEIASKVADGVTWNNGRGQSPKMVGASGREGTKEIKGAATVEGAKVPPRWRETNKIKVQIGGQSPKWTEERSWVK